jgi:iron complex outermembrane receptor protein
MRTTARALFPLSLLSAVIINTTPVYAQEAALEEILVTAQRREQNLQEVPVSVTAFTGAALEQRNIKSAIDYLALTPNVSFTEDGQTGSRGLGIAIRGINNLVSGENAFVNSVGIYLDEFSVASVPNQVANPMLPDMQRVEILRGPQGTFFGRNALGGALNLTTNKPSFDAIAGEVIVGGESAEDAGDMYNVTGILNLPVSDTFALRGVGYYEDSDGWVENACRSGASPADCPAAAENGFTPNGADGSGHDYSMFRLHAAWNPSEQLSILASVIYTDEEQDTDENVPSGVLDLDSLDSFGLADGALNSLPQPSFWYNGNQNTLSHDLQESTENKSTVGILNIAYALNDTMTVKWISGIIDAETNRLFDNDLAGGADTLVRTNSYDGDSWSTELRFELMEDRYDFIVGALYAKDKQEQDNNVAISSQPTATVGGVGWLPPFPEGLGLALNSKSWEVESFAVFADLTYRVNDKLELIAGGRYTSDEVTNELQASGIAPGPGCPGAPPCFANFPRPPVSEDDDFDDFSPRLVARYSFTDEVNIYGTISKGYKAGGVAVGNNTNADGQPGFGVPFDEETLWNYELGFKSEFADRRVRLNGSVFYLEWEDLQLESFRFLTPGDLSSNFEQTINIDDAEAFGAELELAAAVTDRITIMSSVGYLDTEITSNTVAEITGGFEVELKGLDIPKAPELTFNVSGEYRHPFGDNEAWIQLEYIHRDGQFSDVESLTYLQTDGPSPNGGPARNSVATFGDYPFRTPDYDIWNLRAGFDMEHWRFVAYVQNLDEEEYWTGTQENFGVTGFRLRPHPRLIGGSVSYRF